MLTTPHPASPTRTRRGRFWLIAVASAALTISCRGTPTPSGDTGGSVASQSSTGPGSATPSGATLEDSVPSLPAPLATMRMQHRFGRFVASLAINDAEPASFTVNDAQQVGGGSAGTACTGTSSVQIAPVRGLGRHTRDALTAGHGRVVARIRNLDPRCRVRLGEADGGGAALVLAPQHTVYWVMYREGTVHRSTFVDTSATGAPAEGTAHMLATACNHSGSPNRPSMARFVGDPPGEAARLVAPGGADTSRRVPPRPPGAPTLRTHLTNPWVMCGGDCCVAEA